MWKFGKTTPVEKDKMGKIQGKTREIGFSDANECSNYENPLVENLIFCSSCEGHPHGNQSFSTKENL